MIERISGLDPTKHLSGASRQSPSAQQSRSRDFKKTLASFLGEVNTLQNKSGESVRKFMAGEITDVHQVMNASQESKIAFNLLMEIRNKVMDGYKEIMRIRL